MEVVLYVYLLISITFYFLLLLVNLLTAHYCNCVEMVSLVRPAELVGLVDLSLLNVALTTLVALRVALVVTSWT